MAVMGTGSVCLLLLLLMAGVMGMMEMVVGAQGDREGEGDGTVMTRESVKAQIDQLESFLEAKSGSVHPSQLQNHWLQLAMLYQVSTSTSACTYTCTCTCTLEYHINAMTVHIYDVM
jgi:hypothetical protein